MTRLLSVSRGLAFCSLGFSIVLAVTAQEPAPKKDKPAETKKEPETKKAEDYIEVPTPFGTMRIPRGPKQEPAEKAGQPAPDVKPVPNATPAQNATQQPPAPTVANPTTPPTPGPGSPPAQVEKPLAQETSSPTNVRLQLDHVDLAQIINIIGSELKINYVVDPKVKGVATISTMGDVRHEDLLPLLDTILKLNGAAIVKTGNFYQIVPRTDAKRLPLPVNKSANVRDDDALMMQVVPMHFVAAKDIAKLLETYVSDGGNIVVHEGANILIIVDTARNIKRLLELVSAFDADILQNQRVQLYPIKNNHSRSLVSELERVFSAYALSSKDSAIRFVSIDRINAILAVSPSPDSLLEVEKWIRRLDQPVENAGVRNHVYKVENGDARNIARVLRQIYSPRTLTLSTPSTTLPAPESSLPGKPPVAETPPHEEAVGVVQGEIKFVADEINNALIIQASPQDYEAILETIKSLDVVPRQVLIDAKIYEVALTGALSFGVQFFLEQRADRSPTSVSFTSTPDRGRKAGLDLQTFARIGATRDLLVFLNAQETRSRTRVLSSPSVIASDNISARIQVGSEVPILTSQGVVPGGTGSSGLFSNTIQNRSTGVILNVTPRINASGWVTLKIQQEVSSPVAPTEGSGIQSPSISIRSVDTQVTVKNGESIALGGIISENRLLSKNRVPFLGDVPGLGMLFGNTTYTNTRTELIAIITPHVIEDIDAAADVTDELKSQLKNLKKEMRDLELSR